MTMNSEISKPKSSNPTQTPNKIKALGLCLGASTVTLAQVEQDIDYNGESAIKTINKPRVVSHALFPHEGNPKKTLLSALTHIDLNSFDDFVRQVRHPEGERVGLPTAFFPMQRVERISLDEPSGDIYQGQTLLKGLTELERSVLAFLIKQTRLRHTKTDLIFSTWPDELRQQGVTDNSLYQVVLAIRRAIEPTPSQPVYLITWRGKPEGGYQFFPEGRPG